MDTGTGAPLALFLFQLILRVLVFQVLVMFVVSIPILVFIRHQSNQRTWLVTLGSIIIASILVGITEAIVLKISYNSFYIWAIFIGFTFALHQLLRKPLDRLMYKKRKFKY